MVLIYEVLTNLKLTQILWWIVLCYNVFYMMIHNRNISCNYTLI